VSEAERILRAAADLVYSHRPAGELPGIVSIAQRLGTGAVWRQSGLASDGTKDPRGCWMEQGASRAARTAVESAAFFPAPDVIPRGTSGVAVWPRDGAPSPMIADRGEIVGHTREKGRYGDSATAAGSVPGPILR
jgi:hypothetical protein